MQPIIYNSLDADAPRLTIEPGTLKTILKACLVTGYGDKPAAGWEMAWEDADANKMALRSKNLTSIKSVLLIDDGKSYHAAVTAYKDWDSAKNTGVDKFAGGYFVKRWDLNVNNRITPNWVIVATDKFFYLFVQTEKSSRTMRAMSGFGDAMSLRTDKVYAALLASSDTSYTQNSTGYDSVRTNNGVAEFPQSLFPKSSTSTRWGDRGKDDDNADSSNTAILSQFALYIDVDKSGKAGTKRQPILQLPGMLMPHAPTFYEKQINNIQMISKQFPYVNPILGMYQPWHGRVWIHTDDWGR